MKKPEYTSDLPIRCKPRYSVAYMYVPNQQDSVRLCVSKSGSDGIKPLKGDQKVFPTLEKAREFAYNHGYIVYYEENEKRLNKK
tara:strand:+ start:921 stop:1172 length:252 start_codon:yes stop_codon:yes gene_type:complete